MEQSSMTTSAVIAFAERLEEHSLRFYKQLASLVSDNEKEFLKMAEDSKKNLLSLRTTYRETISDALEACYCFRNLKLSDYKIDFSLQQQKLPVLLKASIELEANAIKFYNDIAESSQNLLATMAYVFQRIANKRSLRKKDLKSISIH